MKKQSPVFTVFCVVFLFAFVVFMAWYIPSMSSVVSGTAETRQSLETSRGRENKQRDEYTKAMEELPLAKARLHEIAPLAEQAEERVNTLKARRKELRSEKTELEQKIAGVKEDETNEE